MYSVRMDSCPTMNARPIPFKVRFSSRGSARVGIAASSYQHLRQIVSHKYRVSGEFCFLQEDGTIVCDEDYFSLLEPRTTLTIIEIPPRPHPPPPPPPPPPLPTVVAASFHTLRPDRRSCWRDPPYPPYTPYPPYLERKRPASFYDPALVEVSPPKKHHPNNFALPQHALGAVRQPMMTQALSHPPLANTRPFLQRVQRVGPSYPAPNLRTLPSLQCQYNQVMVRPAVVNPLIPGIVPLKPLPKGMGVTPRPVAWQPQVVNAEANVLPASLVSQLQITSVVGNARMSLSPRKLSSPTVAAGKGSPPPLEQILLPHPVPPPSRSPSLHQNTGPPCQPTRLSAERFGCSISACGCQQRVSATSERSFRAALIPTASPRRERVSEIDLAPLLGKSCRFQHESTANSSTDPPQPSKPATEGSPPALVEEGALGADSVCPEPRPLREGVEPETEPRPLRERVEPETEPRPLRERVEPETEPCPLREGVEPETEPRPLREGGEPETEPRPLREEPRTESEEPVMKVKVVCRISEQDPSTSSETDTADDEDEDRGSQLCIVEQACPTLDPTSTSPDNHQPLYHVPFAPSPHPRSLGDAPCPIVIKTESKTTVVNGDGANVCSPDDGYSSSTSPLESAPCDFASLLPFANYDEPRPTGTTGGQNRPQGPHWEPTSTETLELDSDSNTNQTDLNSSWELAGDEEDLEEDFVIDIEVFSPVVPSPSPPPASFMAADTVTKLQESADPPELIPPTNSTDDDESGDKGDDGSQLIVKIDRGSLTQPHYSTSPLTPTNDHPKPSRRLTVSLPLTPPPLQRKKRLRKRHSCSDPTYRPRPGLKLPSTQVRRRRPMEVPKLMVRIPIHHGTGSRIVCEDEETVEESDESDTIMELLASRLEGKTANSEEEERRVPEIVHLQPHYPGDGEDSSRQSPNSSRGGSVRQSPEPTAEVAEYLTLPSVCSANDLSHCFEELSRMCGGGGEGGEEGVAISVSLEVGGEVELAESSVADTCPSPELTGMELLNLRHNHHTSPNKEEESRISTECRELSFSKVDSGANVYCEQDLAAEIQEKLSVDKRWRVHLLTHSSGDGVKDPRLRVQRYSLGNKDLFELSCVSGRWQLKSLHDNQMSTLDKPITADL